VGLLLRAEELPALRAKIGDGGPRRLWEGLLAELPKQVERLQQAEITAETMARDYQARGPALAALLDSVPLVAFHYLLTGDAQHVPLVCEKMAPVLAARRVGWFTWDGGSWPHIDAGRVNRLVAVAYDWLYEALSEADRRAYRAFMAAAVADFVRLNLAVPGAPMHHFRTHNQGNNQMASAILCALALRGQHPDAEQWLRALTDTLLWNLTVSVGPCTQDLEPDLQGYWMISLDALIQAALALRNVLGYDLTAHPHLRGAVDYAVAHLVPSHPLFYHGWIDGAIKTGCDEQWPGYVWVQNKPTATPHPAQVGATFLFLASRFGDARALELWRTAYRPDDQTLRGNWMAMPHLGNLGGPLSLAWYPTDLTPAPIIGPDHFFTNRLAMLRTGLKVGATYLLLNGGDLTLIAHGELLGTGTGLVWHHPWFQYALAQNTVWTEGEDVQPSFRLTQTLAGSGFGYFRAEAASSNVCYYRKREQEESYKHFQELARDVLFVGGRYFVFLDRVAHAEPRAHTWVWNTLNTDGAAECQSGGVEESGGVGKGPRVWIRRPGAVLVVDFVAPDELTLETQPQKVMPVWYFAWGDLGKTLLARAGHETLPETDPIVCAADGWSLEGESGQVTMEVGHQTTGPPDHPVLRLTGFEGRPRLVQAQEVAVDAPGYYRLALRYRKRNLRHYHNPSWWVKAQFLDAGGNVLVDPDWQNPTAAWVDDLNTDLPDLDWTVVSRRFFVPEGVARLRLVFDCVETPGQSRTVRPDEPATLELGPVTVAREPDPVRRKREQFLTVLTPLAPEEAAPEVTRHEVEGGAAATVRTGEDVDTILSCTDGVVRADQVSARARLALVRRREEKVAALFLADATFLAVAGGPALRANRPVTLAWTAGGPAWLRVGQATEVEMALTGRGKLAGRIEPGVYRLASAGQRLIPERDPGGDPALAAHPAQLDDFRAGLAPYLAQLAAERDALAPRRNLAQGARVRASGAWDERFGPERVVDHEVADAAGDGSFTYDQPPILSGRLTGYGAGDEGAELYGHEWPYRIHPTYWLAPDEQPDAWVELDLGTARPVALVRLLNTSNGGFNDRAALDFRVDLLDAAREVVASRTGQFGQPWPGPVTNPQPPYAPTYRFWYDPDTPFPFGAGWQTMEFAEAPPARFVRVTVTRYWGFGAGLNEVQVYGPESQEAGSRRPEAAIPTASCFLLTPPCST